MEGRIGKQEPYEIKIFYKLLTEIEEKTILQNLIFQMNDHAYFSIQKMFDQMVLNSLKQCLSLKKKMIYSGMVSYNEMMSY